MSGVASMLLGDAVHAWPWTAAGVGNEVCSSSLAAALLHDIRVNRATDLIDGYQVWVARHKH